jgi:hypothetical protein
MDESRVKKHVLVSERTKRLISVFIKIEKLRVFLKLKCDTHRQKFMPDAYTFFLFWEGKQAVNRMDNDQVVGTNKQLFCWPNIARSR